MRIAILHYHLRPGGVTRVIEMAVEALQAEGVHPLVISGEPAPGQCRVPCVEVVKDLAYGETDSKALQQGVEAACRRRWGAEADILHTHNHCLGKNLSLPLAVKNWALQGRALITQIHDFAENGRPSNYQLLRDGLGGAPGLERCLYPSGERVLTGVLNSSAAALLRHAGGHPVVLANPVSLPLGICPAWAEELGAARTVVYPTRGIRRKNLGEALLHAAGLDKDNLLVITSSPAPGPERPDYESWQEFASGLGLPVLFDASTMTGRPVYDFLAGADLCLTTSVEEGFGMAFLEPWTAGKGLAGRDLPDITCDFKSTGLCLDALYTSLQVTLPESGARELQVRLAREEASAAAAFGIPAPQHPVGKALSQRVDFAILPPEMQREQIQRAKSGKWKVPPLQEAPPSAIENNSRVIRAHYAPQAYAKRLLDLYKKLCDAPHGEINFLDTRRILSGFLIRPSGRLSRQRRRHSGLRPRERPDH